jgi:hypothetical protein
MKRVWVLVLIAGCGGSGSSERSVCDHVGKLCDGDHDEIDKCESQLKALKSTVGDGYGKMLDCAAHASSCAEGVGCFVGGVGGGMRSTLEQFGKGVQEAMGTTGDGDDVDLDKCGSFDATDSGVRWDGCSDHKKREIACKPFMEQLECECLRDGEERWFFDAKTAPTGDRAAATAIAREQCKMF